jgi:hypothetical protein
MLMTGRARWTTKEGGNIACITDFSEDLISFREGKRRVPTARNRDEDEADVEYVQNLCKKVVREVRRLLPHGTLNNTMRGATNRSRKVDVAYGYVTNVKHGGTNQQVEKMVEQLMQKGPNIWAEPKRTAAQMMAISTAARQVGGGVCAHIAHVSLGVLSTLGQDVHACVVEHSADHYFILAARDRTQWYVIDPWVGISYVCPLADCYFGYEGIRVSWEIEVHAASDIPYGFAFLSPDVNDAYNVAKGESGVAPELADHVWAHDSNLAQDRRPQDFLLAANPLEWGAAVG